LRPRIFGPFREASQYPGKIAAMFVLLAERIGSLLQRFLTEVIASVVTTACVAAATTAFLHYSSKDVPRPPAEPDMAGMLSPVADSGATRFVSSAGPAKPKRPALPPARPKLIAAAAKPAAQEPRGRAEERTNNDLFAPPVVPVVDAEAFGEPQAEPAGPQVASAQFAPPPLASPERKEERRLLGVPVPDALPSNGDVVKRLSGWREAVTGLLP
jgi:hypothetical protein